MSIADENIYSWNVDSISIFVRYFLFAGISYFIFYFWKYKSISHLKLQDKFPEPAKIKSEILYSVITLTIFCFISWLVFYCYQHRITRIYSDFYEYGFAYFIFSILLMVFIHDAYFYWTHRLMHLPSIFRAVHKIHHHSDNPTPWAAFSFHPFEAIIATGIIPLIVFTIPVHPYALFIFLTYMTLINVMGHLGFEIFSKIFTSGKFGKFQNTATNHNLHHTNSKFNFGLYFTFWDRVMKTYYEKEKT